MCNVRVVPADSAYTRFSIALGDRGLRALGKLNVPLYRASRGRLLGSVGRAPVLLLTSTGRKSGQERTAPVLYMEDGDRLVVIGSNAGNERPPAWSLNLKANPEASVQVRGERRKVRARVAQGEERADLWRRMTERYSGFDEYRGRTGRDIAVFVLEPR
ncbi:MAG TPA: nitroreductase family deazaflavin-dependent oxidoreductase [Thermoleophilaceae bacterium]